MGRREQQEQRGHARLWLAALSFSLLLLAPELASACAVCFSSSEESRIAFLLTTLFLSGLPLALIGGLILWLRRRIRAAEALAAPNLASSAD